MDIAGLREHAKAAFKKGKFNAAIECYTQALVRSHLIAPYVVLRCAPRAVSTRAILLNDSHALTRPLTHLKLTHLNACDSADDHREHPR